MPIDYHIDHAHRLVVARGHGVFGDEDVFSYQHKVWSRPEVIGYDELIDMTAVEEIAIPSTKRIPELAELAANDLAFGLGRMFEVYRNLHSRSTKKMQVCRTMREAYAFLGLKGETPDAAS